MAIIGGRWLATAALAIAGLISGTALGLSLDGGMIEVVGLLEEAGNVHDQVLVRDFSLDELSAQHEVLQHGVVLWAIVAPQLAAGELECLDHAGLLGLEVVEVPFDPGVLSR